MKLTKGGKNEASNRLSDMQPLQIRLAQTKERQETPRLLGRRRFNFLSNRFKPESKPTAQKGKQLREHPAWTGEASNMTLPRSLAMEPPHVAPTHAAIEISP